MVNIKSSLSISSTTFFPSNASIATNITETFTGDADFQSIVVPADSTAVVFEPSGIGSSPSTVFLYIQSPATNVSGFAINLIGVTETPILLATLLPKDFICLPLAVTSTNVQVHATNLNGANSGSLNIFWGVR
jgi:hypothetical protein